MRLISFIYIKNKTTMTNKKLLSIQSYLLYFLVFLGVLTFLSSCGVSKSEHFSLKRSYEKLQSNNDYLQKKYDACEAENKEMEKKLKGGAVQKTFNVENVKIELMKCTQTKEMITCELLYTSKRQDKEFNFRSLKAYHEGNEYKPQEIRIGAKKLHVKTTYYDLPSDTSVKGTIKLGKFDKKISNLELLTMVSNLDWKTPIEFKNIPVQQSKS